MKTVILGGPALALDNSIKTRHYTIIDVDSLAQIASIVSDTEAKTRKLIIHSSIQTEEHAAAVCKLLKSVAPNYVPITAEDSHGVTLAYLLSSNVASNDPDIISAWTSLNFELEISSVQRDGSTNKIRFTGANIGGIKQIANASVVKFTVTEKRK